MFADGIYQIAYRSAPDAADGEQALVILSKGEITGSDPHGGVYFGTATFDPATRRTVVRLAVEVPPRATVITGRTVGPEGATLDVDGAFKIASPATDAVVYMDGKPVSLPFVYLGPLPD